MATPATAPPIATYKIQFTSRPGTYKTSKVVVLVSAGNPSLDATTVNEVDLPCRARKTKFAAPVESVTTL